MIGLGLANSIRPIGLDLSRSSEFDTVTKRRPVRTYMRVIRVGLYTLYFLSLDE